MHKLRTHLSGRTSLKESCVEVGDKHYRLLHPHSAEALIDEAEFERDERMPYWADVWPSSIALAGYLARMDLSWTRTIELGCGLGLPSVVALDRGAEVVATDHYEIALEFARHNARINTGRDLTVAHLDWYSPVENNLGKFDLVLAADVLYERRNVAALTALIPALLAPGGEVLISDPRRKDAPCFIERMEGLGFRCSTQTDGVWQGDKAVEVRLHRFFIGSGEIGSRE